MRALWYSLKRSKGILIVLMCAGFCILGAAFVLTPAGQFSSGERLQLLPTPNDKPISPSGDNEIQATFGVSTAAGDQIVPDIAYNGVDENYLIAWQDKRYTNLNDYGDIFIHLTNADGGFVGGEINLTGAGILKQSNPQVAYDYGSYQYVVLWQEDIGANDNNIIAQRLDASLNPIGESVLIQNTNLSEQNPIVVGNATEGGFLIVWEDCPKDAEFPSCDISARYMGADGSLSSQILIATGINNQRYPAVAYNSWQDEYLVVWEEYLSVSDSDIKGQRVDWNGGLIGSPFDIEAPGGLQTKPDIAYNFYNNEYMVVWEDQWGGALSDWDIKAWRLDGSGGQVQWYMISYEDTKRRMNPSIAYADGAHEYLIAYEYEYTGTDIDLLYSRIKSDGELRVEDSILSNLTDINENSAALVANFEEKYFAVWEDARNYGTTGIDIYGNLFNVYKFSGNVYLGEPGNYASPMEGVSVDLYCSGSPGEWGYYLESSVTDSSGYFSVVDHGGCLYYNIVETNPSGFVSTGAIPPSGGDKVTDDWIRFVYPLEGKNLSPSYFWDVQGTSTPTITGTPTQTGTPTPTNTPLNTPTPTNTPLNTPTPTNTPLNTPTPTNTPLNTPTPTNTPLSTPTPTDTPTNTPTHTNTPQNTPTPTNTIQVTLTNTSTSTQTPTVTNTPTPTATATITYPITWIHFEEFSGGTYINDHYAEQGLHFMSDYLFGYGFRAAPFIQSSAFARSAPNILVNNATGGEFFSSINVPMVFWFDQPMAKLGMWLGAVGETCNSVPVTIVVYDCKGSVISSNQYTTNQSFIPLEIDDELGRIQRVKIDFGGSTCLEAVDELAFQQSDAAKCLDYSNPIVTIEQPVAGSNFSSPGIMIQGTIDETGILRSATLNGSRLPVYMNSLTGIYKFNKPVTLQPGSNTYLAAADNYSNKPGSDIAWYTLGAPSSVTLKEFHLTQRGVVKNLSCDIDNPFVAAKSTLVRIKLDVKTATGASAHVSSVDLKVYRSYDFVTESLVDTVSGASYPSWGTSFVSSAQMDEILFWVSSDTFQEAGYYRFEIQPWVGAGPFGPPIQLNCGGKWFPFNATRHLKLLIVPVEAGLNSPLLADTSHNADFIKQLAVTSRTLPLADQVYPYYGVTYQEIAPFKMCDGTTNSTTMYPNICLGTGWEWKHIDKDPSGVLNRMYDAYVEDQNTGFCNTKDHTNGGRELGVGLIPYNFNPQLGIFRPGAHPGWNYAADNIAKHQTPIDEDHDNDIDLTDLSLYIGSHYDETQGKWLLYPSGYYNMGETFRFFGDLNNNNCNDTQSDYQTPILKKFHPSILDKPQEEAFLSYNAAIPGTSNDFTSGVLVFPYTFVATDSRYGDIGPGQGSSPGHNIWIRLFPNSNAFAHELGHNTAGLGDQYYDNVADDLLTKENASAVYVGTVKLPPNQAWIVMGSDAGWNRVVHWKPDYQSLFDKLKIGPILNNSGIEENVEVFILTGYREQDGSLSHLQSQRAMDVEQTPSDPVSPYKLVFGSGTTTLLEYPFTAGVQSPPAQGYLDVTIYPMTFAVIAPWPDGTAWVEVRKNADVLARFDQSGAAPSVNVISPNAGEDFTGMNETEITWISGDTDSDPNSLVHSIFYSVDGGTTWTLIASNVGGNQFTWPLNNLPGTTQGLVKVVVSDGFLSGEDSSNDYFTLANKPPTAVILTPTGDNDILQCGKIQLDGVAIDPEEAIQSITWSVDGIPVTSYLQDFIPPQSPGLHTITLEVKDNIDQTGSDSMDVNVIDDLDCDGMPDEWETIQSFDFTNPNDAGQDADNDGVTNRDEFFWRIDPHNPDTDGDGIPDGTEIAQGTDPAVPEPGPVWQWIYLPVITR